MGPPSSGASTVGETLNILQDFSRRGVAFANRTDLLHKYLEASRLAYADRGRYLGDPSFVSNPIAGLLSNEYAATRAALIGPKAATGAVAPGTPPGATPAAAASIERVGSTTHLSVADTMGNIVSYTFTIESTGGNGIVVPGYGFLLNNELTDFDINSVTAPNRPDANKRPRSSMAPTIVMKDDKPFLTLGSPGGATIITTVGQTLVNRINSHMTIAGRARGAASEPAQQRDDRGRVGLRELIAGPAARQLVRRALPRAGRRRDRRADRDRVEGRQALPGGRGAGPPRRRQRDGGHAQSVSTGRRAWASSTTASASASASIAYGPVATAATRT